MSSQEELQRVPLGSSDLRISPMGIGTWAWGSRLYWGYGSGSYTDADIEAAFNISREGGINFFDTSEIYGQGRSEQLLGQFVRNSGRREVVATKFFPYPWRLRKGALLQALRGSLDRLGMDKVDLYQIHWPLPPVPIKTWMDGLADAVKAGLVQTIGVSNYDAEQTRRAHTALKEHGVPLISNQVHFSLLNRQPEKNGLLNMCRELSITLIAYSPLEMGLLTGKYTPENPPSGVRGRRYPRKYLARIQPLIGLLREIGSAHGNKTAAQVALNWVMCKGAVPIPGAKSARQAEENLAALGWRLTDDEVATLDRASEEAQR